jgi:hypothetical protein
MPKGDAAEGALSQAIAPRCRDTTVSKVESVDGSTTLAAGFWKSHATPRGGYSCDQQPYGSILSGVH